MNTFRSKTGLIVALSSVALAAGCSDDNGGNDVVASNDGGGGDGDGGGDGGSQTDGGQVRSDGQIAAVVSTANRGEIAQGNIALTKAQAPQVLDFAQMMVIAHTAVEQNGAQLLAAQGITPEPNEVSTNLKEDSDRIVQQLNTTPPGPEWDRTYIESQVQVHQAVLDLLDEQLIPAAQNQELRQALQTTSQVVQGHLEKAQEIASALEGDAGVADGGAADGGTSDGGDAGTSADGGRTRPGTGIGPGMY